MSEFVVLIVIVIIAIIVLIVFKEKSVQLVTDMLNETKNVLEQFNKRDYDTLQTVEMEGHGMESFFCILAVLFLWIFLWNLFTPREESQNSNSFKENNKEKLVCNECKDASPCQNVQVEETEVAKEQIQTLPKIQATKQGTQKKNIICKNCAGIKSEGENCPYCGVG